MVPPTPDGFDFLDEDPDPLAVCGVAGSAHRDTPVAPLLRTTSEELEDVLGGPGGSSIRSHRREDPLAGVLDGDSLDVPSPVSSCRSKGLWEANSPDPLVDVGNPRATAVLSPAERRDAATERQELVARAEADPLDAAEQLLDADTRSEVRLQRPDPLAGVIEGASEDGPEGAPARRSRQRASCSKQFHSRASQHGRSTVRLPDEEEAGLDAALRSFSKKRAAAALDAAAAVDQSTEEVLDGGSLPASPSRRRVKARPAATTKSVASLRSFACRRAKT